MRKSRAGQTVSLVYSTSYTPQHKHCHGNTHSGKRQRNASMPLQMCKAFNTQLSQVCDVLLALPELSLDQRDACSAAD
jgi:hypothetical protein